MSCERYEMGKMNDAEKTEISGKFHDVNQLTPNDNRLLALIFENFAYDNRLTLYDNQLQLCILKKKNVNQLLEGINQLY